MGIQAKSVDLDFPKLQEWKFGVQTKLINGIKQLLKVNGVTTLIGEAVFQKDHLVRVTIENNEIANIKYKKAVLAIGTTFISLPKFKIDEKTILSAKGLLSVKTIPEELVVIGGGVIGLELGTAFAKLGSRVTVIELLPEILPGVDIQIKRLLSNQLRKFRIKTLTSTTATKYNKLKSGKVSIELKTKEGKQTLSADKILLSVGKKAQVDNLNLDLVNIETDEKGFILTDSKQRTSNPDVYAVGDCIGPPFLAHLATKQGIVAAEVISGIATESDFKAIPIAIFTDPEVSYVGLSEAEAKKAGYEVITGRAPFASSARALTHQTEEGYVKIVAEKSTNLLLGVQIIGYGASDMISELSLALELGATIEDIGFTIHPHPTLPEMIMEASDAALNKAIHQVTLVKRKK
jgi:dihydrolipoamide dehydrogenase